MLFYHTDEQLLFGLVIALVTMIGYKEAAPYWEISVDHISYMCNILVVVTMIALMAMGETQGRRSERTESFLGSSLVAIASFIVVYVFYGQWREKQIRAEPITKVSQGEDQRGWKRGGLVGQARCQQISLNGNRWR